MRICLMPIFIGLFAGVCLPLPSLLAQSTGSSEEAPVSYLVGIATAVFIIVAVSSFMVMLSSLYSKKLERDVESRTKELGQKTEELSRAYGEVKKLNEMKDELFSSVSHELKTPLTTIKGSIELLKDDATETGQKELLKTAEDESNRLGLLIEDLLAISRSANFSEKPARKEISIKVLVEDVLKEMTPKAEEKGLMVESELEDLKLRGDEKLVRRALLNVANNAVKFTDEGRIIIKMWQKGNSAFISVRDTGIGMVKKDHVRIFERFYRVDTGDAKRYYGTGLGLSIAKSIIDSHNGEISVESEVGKGSTFTIELPLNEGE